MVCSLLSKLYILRDAFYGLELCSMTPPTDMKGPIGDIHVAIWKELFRIATALERQCQAYPPIAEAIILDCPACGRRFNDKGQQLLTKKKEETIQNCPEMASPKETPILGGFERGEWVTYAPGKRRWIFTNNEGITKQCTNLCPFGSNCKNFKDGDVCIGLLSRNYRGKK